MKKKQQQAIYEKMHKNTVYSKDAIKPAFRRPKVSNNMYYEDFYDDDFEIEKPHKKIKVVNPNACPLYKKCGGCQLQQFTYAEQIDYKQNLVNKHLKKFGNVSPIISMASPYNYRNKVQSAFAEEKNGRIIAGVYQSRTKHIVDTHRCMLENKLASKIIYTIKNDMKDFKITPFNPYKGSGQIRHILVRVAEGTGEVMVVLVCVSPILPNAKHFVRHLVSAFPQIKTIVLNVNKDYDGLMLSKHEKVLYGPGYIIDKLCGKKFRISSDSFYQVNSIQTKKLYNTAIDMAGLSGKENVIDAYCGVGTIGIIASDKASRVLGIELNKDAISDAKYNAQLNNIKNIEFVADDATDFMLEMANNNERCDVLFMDPPRSGSTPDFLNSAIKLAPKKIVYISCNVETQARDIPLLIDGGYRVQKIQPVDMFPHTRHIEAIIMMTRV